MALKADRVIPPYGTDITTTCESTGSMGQVGVILTSGSGVAIGDSRNKATIAANPSGSVVHGMLLNDVVNIDETLYHINYHKDVTRVQEPANWLRRGKVTTDQFVGTPAVGGVAYLTSSGLLDPTAHATGGIVAKPKVGQWRSIKDADGYATVEVALPIL